MPARKLTIALVGMGFGAEFVPIYISHPDVKRTIICDADKAKVDKICEKFSIADGTTDFDSLVKSKEIDAVHLVTPIPLHAKQAIQVLKSGKHCACTVPMATSIEDLKAIIIAGRESGRNYMMMETAVYTREFFYARDLVESGKLGRIQLLRGAHYQDMEHWPSYWMGLPPMHYATHAVGPLLALAKTRMKKVHCFGSGVMREELQTQYDNPYPIETAIFQLDGSDISAEVTRSLFHTARSYTESFNVYGENMTFEWQQVEKEEPVIFTKRTGLKEWDSFVPQRVTAPDRADLLPPSIGRFTRKGVYDVGNKHLSFEQGGGHGGSHPHLVHEFVRSIVEKRDPWIDSVTAANWTAAGICAHQSAMKGGEEVVVPSVVEHYTRFVDRLAFLLELGGLVR